MTILLRWLIDNSWIFYVACGVGALIYAVRALSAQRERGLALFTLERESATARLVQSWSAVLVFAALAAIIFITTRYVLPAVPVLNPEIPLPTPTLVSGVEPITPSPGPSPTVRLLAGTPLPEFVGSEPEPSPTIPPAPPTAPAAGESTPTPDSIGSPTPLPTDTAQQPVSGDLNVRFHDFARLVGFTVSTAQSTTGAPLQLTLYWQALEGKSPADYVVFTHMLAEDGHLVAQHDGPPAGGDRPMTSWTPGESIADLHPMAFKDLGYVGLARIVVGLYEVGGERVTADSGETYAALPITIRIVSQ